MAEPSTKKKTSSMMPDWTQLPEELLQIIKEKLDNCFDVVHARSICSLWRSTFPLPSFLLRPSYSLPTYPTEKEGLCSLEKIPLVLLRVRAPADVAALDSEYLIGGICRDESEDRMELPSHLQCSVKMKINGSDSTLMNMLGCQIVSMGHQYQMVCWDPEGLRTTYKGVAFLQLNKEGGREFVVLRSYFNTLLVLTSVERKWKRLENIPDYSCPDLVSFGGRFYAAFFGRDIFVINPYSLKVTRLRPSKQRDSINYLVPSGNDELFLVEESFNRVDGLTCRVSRLVAKARRWVEVSDLGDRVLFIGCLGNVACSAKELPDDCGVSGNSILLTTRTGETSFHKYSRGCWRSSRKSFVEILKSKSPALAFRVEY